MKISRKVSGDFHDKVGMEDVKHIIMDYLVENLTDMFGKFRYCIKHDMYDPSLAAFVTELAEETRQIMDLLDKC
jgi:hypothetical protein